jgi:hypothetical protein
MRRLPAATPVSRAQRSMQRSGMVRCRPGTVPVCGGPGSAVPWRVEDARDRAYGSTSLRAAPRPGHAIASDAFVALFTFQTAQLVPATHICVRGLQPCFTHPESRGGRSAEKRSGACEAPVRRIMTRYARRLRGALRPITRDARLSALHRGGFSPGAALPSPSAPAAMQRRAFAFRIRAVSSSQPGRSAWRAGSRASRGEQLRAAAAGRHASLRLRDRL